MFNKKVKLSVIVASLLASTFIGCGNGGDSFQEDNPKSEKLQTIGKVSAAKAIVNKNVVKTGDSVDFTVKNVSSSDNFSYEWKDDTNRVVSTKSSFNVAYDKKGVHKTTLTVYDKSGKSCVSKVAVKVVEKKDEQTSNKKPTANIEVSKSEISQGEEVTFSATSSSDSDGNIVKYMWRDCCGVLLSTESSFTKKFDKSGSQKIRLTVVDDKGACSSTITTIKVKALPNDKPIAEAGDEQSVTEGSTVVFDGSNSSDSDGTIKRYEWRLNGCIISNEAKFEKSDFVVGEYELELTIIDNLCAKATDKVKVTVTPKGQGNQKPVAKAKVNYTSAPEGTEIVFDASDSSDLEGDIISYEWRDKYTKTRAAGDYVVLSRDKVFKTKTLAVGKHEITLVVTDSDGLVAINSMEVIIENLNVANTSPMPVIKVKGNSDEVTNQTLTIEEGTSLTLSGEESFDIDGDEIVEYKWEGKFEDTYSDLGSQKTLILSNLKVGTYIFWLFLTDGIDVPTIYSSNSVRIEVTKKEILEEQKDTIKPVITLKGSATVNLTVGESYTDAGATASDDKDGVITTRIVKTGSVTTSTAGTYTIKYNVSDDAGNHADEITRTVIVKEKEVENKVPVIESFTISTTELYLGEQLGFNGSVTDLDGTKYSIQISDSLDGDFGGSEGVGVIGKKHPIGGRTTPRKVGTHIFSITATDGLGGTATKKLTYVVKEKQAPVASNVYITGVAKVGETLTGHYTYSDAENDPEYNSAYTWRRDDGKVLASQTKSYTIKDLDAGKSITFEVQAHSKEEPRYRKEVSSTPIKVAEKDVPNQKPKPNSQSVRLDEDSSKSITLTGTDTDGTIKDYLIITPPHSGHLTGSGQNVTYTPNKNYHGHDFFTFKVIDDKNLESSVIATVSIDVNSVNDKPIITSFSVTPKIVFEGEKISVSADASDVDGDSLTYKWTANGNFIAPSKSWETDFGIGKHIIKLEVSDGRGGVVSKSETIEVKKKEVENDAPIVENVKIGYSNEGARLRVLSYDYSDKEGDDKERVEYTWWRDGAKIVDEHRGSYILTSDDIGKSIKAKVRPIAKTGTVRGSVVSSNSILVSGNSQPQDTTKPVITLKGISPKTIKVGETYIDAGALATDDIDNSVEVVIDTSAVNTSETGTYYVIFTAKDSAGNVAEKKRRTVIVEEDNSENGSDDSIDSDNLADELLG